MFILNVSLIININNYNLINLIVYFMYNCIEIVKRR
jgi:hypothetical protein